MARGKSGWTLSLGPDTITDTPMVFFFLTRAGYDDLRRFMEPAGPTSIPVWLNQGVLSDQEVTALREAGASVTCFSSPIDSHVREHVEDALATIAEHHPNAPIWIEANEIVAARGRKAPGSCEPGDTPAS